MAETETAQQNGSTTTSNPAGDAAKAEGTLENLSALVDRLERRVRTLVDETGQDALADGRRRIQENPLTSVLLAMGIGLILGLILGGRRG
jgi:ElaB/YqjD/DUF883 family membrane-anchored ribosome-binding protein